jgi:hypothetical protein
MYYLEFLFFLAQYQCTWDVKALRDAADVKDILSTAESAIRDEAAQLCEKHGAPEMPNVWIEKVFGQLDFKKMLICGLNTVIFIHYARCDTELLFIIFKHFT